MSIAGELRRLARRRRQQRARDGLKYDWEALARPEQRWPGGDWRIWLILAGRGWGKTRTGAEAVRRAINHGARRIALVGRTLGDARAIMADGASGLRAVFPPGERPVLIAMRRELRFANGARAFLYSGDRPDLLRGPEHDFAWGDEVAAWRYPETLDMLLMGLRLGRDPRLVLTTTPRPTALIRNLAAGEDVFLTRGRTLDNAANLPASVLQFLQQRYGGSRLGRQELDGEILGDAEGALFRIGDIDAARRARAPALARIVIGLDPAVGGGTTGIVVVGADEGGHAYVLGDHSARLSPLGWAREVAACVSRYGAHAVIAETNQGGDLIAANLALADVNAAIRPVHAHSSKQGRAAPVAALYEAGRVHHIGVLAELEEQMTGWIPGSGTSPDRLDALVWAVTALLLGSSPAIRVL